MDELVFDLARADTRNLVGGKALGLGDMVRADFTVPRGFVLSTDAFMRMSSSLQDLLLRSFDALNAAYVAVRSSAMNEDGADAAWAGQLDTFLNVNRDNLLRSVEACWQSAGSARAQAYAKQKAVHGTKVAVLVQQMVQSEISGVAFSVHPVSHNRTQVVIEAGLGLGEAVVSGAITPDMYVADKKTGRPIEKHVVHQKKKLAKGVSGETEWHDIGAQGAHQKLSDVQISELCRLTVQLETFFKHPVDVEWAVADGMIYILQSRPITTLFDP